MEIVNTVGSTAEKAEWLIIIQLNQIRRSEMISKAVHMHYRQLFWGFMNAFMHFSVHNLPGEVYF